MSEEKHVQSPVTAATSSVIGGTKGAFAGGIVGGALWAGVGAATLGAVAALTTLLSGDGMSLNAIGLFAGGGAILGGVSGVAVNSVVGGLSGAVAGHNNTALDHGPSKEQVAQMAYAQGMVQGATMAKVENLEHTQEEHSTKWRDQVGAKKPHDSHVAMVNDQASKAALAAMDPQGRA